MRKDVLIGGDGDDTIVVLGDIVAGEYSADDVTGTAAEVLGLSDEIQSSHSTDIAISEVYDGGNGNDVLEVWGSVDLSAVTDISNIEKIAVHSNVNITETQLAQLTTQSGGLPVELDLLDIDSQLRIVGSRLVTVGTGDTAVDLDVADISVLSSFLPNISIVGDNGESPVIGVNFDVSGVPVSYSIEYEDVVPDIDTANGIASFIDDASENSIVFTTNVGNYKVDIDSGDGEDIIVVNTSNNATIRGGSGYDVLMLGEGEDVVVYIGPKSATDDSDIICSFGTADKWLFLAESSGDFMTGDGTVKDMTNYDGNDRFGATEYLEVDNLDFTSATNYDAANNIVFEISSQTAVLSDGNGDSIVDPYDFMPLFGADGSSPITFGSQNDKGAGFIIVYDSTAADADAYLFYVDISTNSDGTATIGADDTVQFIGIMKYIGADVLTDANFI